MIILKAEQNMAPVFSLDDGDIFKYAGSYYITGEINMPDNCRECFNLSDNCIFRIRYNPTVEYWHSANVKLLLSNKEI